MRQIFYSTLVFISLVFQSCSNLICSRLPRRFALDIAANIKYLAPSLLNRYHSNSTVKVDSLSDQVLKKELRSFQIEYFQVLYKFDSTFSKPYQVAYINRNNSDSIIILGKFMDMQNFRLSAWGATFEVDYFFGKIKPRITEFKDEFKSVLKKINDTVYFTRTNFPIK